MQPNSSFSTLTEAPIQLGIDSTSLGEFKKCPRSYWLRIIQGWVPKETSAHLVFGIALHAGAEAYVRGKAEGKGHEDCLRLALRKALELTWNKELNRPWPGDRLIPAKTRLTLARSLVWYLDQFGAEDPLETVILASGSPAVELSFRFSADLFSPTGEPVLFCGHLDRIASMGGKKYVVDIKTTGSGLGSFFFDKFSPDNQFSMYALAAQVAFQEPVDGLIVDGIQVLVEDTRFQRAPVPRGEGLISEWWEGAKLWVMGMHEMAVRAFGAGEAAFPQNDKSCSMYGGCPYRGVCSRPPVAREQWLRANFSREPWDPLTTRGDV